MRFRHASMKRSLMSAAVFMAALYATDAARAQSAFDAHYIISMTGISIGEAKWNAEIAPDHYGAKAAGGATGMLAVLVSGTGTVDVNGTVKDGRLAPTHFVSAIDHDNEKAEFKMELADGNVTALDATAPAKGDNRLPVTDEHKHGIIDPISAMLIPAAADGDVLAQSACARTLPIFDGRRRYDLALSFKRMDKVKAEKGYQGPALVCAVKLLPIAGYRADSKLVKYLAGDREIELWLAPIGNTRVLAPFRLSISSLVGTMVIAADRFEATTRTASSASK